MAWLGALAPGSLRLTQHLSMNKCPFPVHPRLPTLTVPARDQQGCWGLLSPHGASPASHRTLHTSPTTPAGPATGPGPTLSAMSSSTPSTGPGGGSCRASMVRAPDCCRCLWRRDDRPVQRSFSRARRVEKGSDHGARPVCVSKPGTVQRQSSGAAGRAPPEGLPAGRCDQGPGKRGPHRPGLLLCQLLGRVLCTWAIKQDVTPLGNVK